MTTEKKSVIFVAEVDTIVPPYITNDFSKYTDIRPLTQGGKAGLWLAKDTNLGRQVVIKRLKPNLANDRRELRRLIREARITAQLQHTGSVPLYELGRDDEGNWYFAMKRVVGKNLFQILVQLSRGEEDAVKEFTLNRLINIFLDVCDTLAYAHVRGIIHRDIKPENVLVGSFGEVVLLDWGVAKVWGMPNEGDEDTIHDRGGTPLYMSPEQVLGNHYIDERSDIFSLGVLLYEILAIKEPFRGRQIRQTFDNIIHETPQLPSEAAPDRQIPKALEEICMKALEKKPQDRYQSVTELVDEVEGFLNQALLRGSV
jgi:serine/threonine protein kinase